MKQWINYIQQRFSPFSFPVITGGIAASGAVLGQGNFPISFIGIALIFVILRLDNDLKDLGKDKIVYPNRPLPSGQIKLKDFHKGLKNLWIVQYAYLLIVLLFLPWNMGIFYALSVLGLWLIASYYPRIRNPLAYNLTRQLILIPIAFFVCGFGLTGLAFGLTLYGSFSLYDICRKLDPFSHPAILSLPQFYGFNKTYLVAMVLASISALGAYLLEAQLLLWPCEIGVLYTMSLLFKSPRKYHIPALAASLSLLIHVWIGISTIL